MAFIAEWDLERKSHKSVLAYAGKSLFFDWNAWPYFLRGAKSVGSDTLQTTCMSPKQNAAMMGGSFLRSFSCLVSLAFVTFKDAESFKLLSLEGEAANLTEHEVSPLSQHDTHAVLEEAEEEAEDEADNEGIRINKK